MYGPLHHEKDLHQFWLCFLSSRVLVLASSKSQMYKFS